ncbi:hypothetical protein CC1G_12796 [Coprinopsis cinerea okayama7|uniref:Uncharacterized protein n=1 Tax=Coprinopsis cinerea (strain Okayama-7 / 130 / ATCC MYA-4618 / FGSC 9003) TaxID=240176 RepID=A8P3G7_COPC7|nr:hypothetical protein CC1G_12796 [Coprinopsis cinerea okayama7\|eukprot:XP_001838545.1 hypothetical protein CC1G_12796 [Coprinopsis cinerea okayama7\
MSAPQEFALPIDEFDPRTFEPITGDTRHQTSDVRQVFNLFVARPYLRLAWNAMASTLDAGIQFDAPRHFLRYHPVWDWISLETFNDLVALQDFDGAHSLAILRIFTQFLLVSYYARGNNTSGTPEHRHYPVSPHYGFQASRTAWAEPLPDEFNIRRAMRAVFTREQATALGLQVPQDRPQDLPGPTFVPRRVRNGTNYSWNRTTTNPIILRYDELLASPLFQEARSWLGQGQLFNASHTIYQLNLELGRPTERPHLPLVVASVIDVGDGVSVIDYATNGALSETQPFPTTVFSPARPVIRSISAHRRDASKASEKAVEPLSGTQVTPRTDTSQADTGPKQGASSSGAHSSGASPKTPKSTITKSTKALILQHPSESVGILEEPARVAFCRPAGLLHANLPLEPAEGSVVPAPNFDPTKVAAEFPRTADLKTHVPGVPRGLRQEDGEYRPPPSSSFQAFPTTEDFARQTEEIARARAETPLEDRIDLTTQAPYEWLPVNLSLLQLVLFPT